LCNGRPGSFERSKPACLHVCEGAIRLSDGRTDESTGKVISYLVSDFFEGERREQIKKLGVCVVNSYFFVTGLFL